MWMEFWLRCTQHSSIKIHNYTSDSSFDVGDNFVHFKDHNNSLRCLIIIGLLCIIKFCGININIQGTLIWQNMLYIMYVIEWFQWNGVILTIMVKQVTDIHILHTLVSGNFKRVYTTLSSS